MESDGSTIRNELARTLGDMAESVIRRESPFDRLPLQSEVVPYLYTKYLQYSNDMEASLRERVCTSLVEYARWEIQTRLCSEKSCFNAMCPHHDDAKKAFVDWILQKEGPSPPIPPLRLLPIEKFNIGEVILSTVLKRIPELKHDRSLRKASTMAFSISLLNKNKIFLIADKGTNRRFIDISFCTYYPRSYVDMANFFSNSQSRYRYSTKDDLAIGINRALDIIEILLPQFVDRVKKVLSRGQ